MSNLQIGFLIVICFGLGALPLTGLVVRWISRTDLSQLGTGNVGVSAAFTHAGKAAGIAAALVEILRGITPVLLARFLLPSQPAWELVGLIALIAGRYWIGRGGGVTNATWGILIYFPPIAISVGLTGLVLWKLLRLNRLRGARWACASGPIWVWIWHQWPRQMPLSIWELMAAVVLASLLIWININQSDDLGLYMKRQDSANLDQELDPQRYGDKAARLSQLKQSGFQVPMGWVLPAVSQEDTETPKSSNPLIPEIHFPLIVRSSAIGEDTDAHSAAGQYQTISAVTDETELVQAIAQCRQSYWSNAAVAYRQERQIPDQGIAVLIQPYIASQVAGVMFSRNPLDGAARVIIEALPGGAEAVVGGQQTPLHLEIDISSIEAQEENLSRLDTAILPSQILKQLVELARRIEGFYHGLPLDIEWGWDGETIWIFQTRPITNLRPIWTRTIAAEVIPGAIRPLTWSINRPLTCGVWGQIFSIVLGKKAANLDFTETATLLGSHAYFNATLLGEIFRMMGLPEQG
ncbi:MAG: glycerol-3-phosphate acyltransferase [Microcoleaceae cyanobacterium]